MSTILPPQFAELERFVPRWAHDTVDARIDARCRSTMDEIRDFYDATIERAAEILDYLEPLPMSALPEDAARLMKLILALAQASIAVEIQGQPMPPKCAYPYRVSLISGVAPFGFQPAA